ncbi:MAG: prepilin-type N-terminal cleavage/methylation domain-containing protein [Candidatus Eremiobacteraeota bacterium]|nr:prepilin-type N-terminal cleavage/methylation domain-containing protein [Candidatus Eremiobacteraeota bacterium]MCW5866741.1 prepilin-type N-terminal cleavage/methylation domain-containing protein [Candidatus Eremiobacteraeota bacterium]
MQRRRGKQGFSLVEVLVAMALALVVLLISSEVVIELLRKSRPLTAEVNEELLGLQFGRQFRADLETTPPAGVSVDSTSVALLPVLELSDQNLWKCNQVLHYAVQDGRLLRRRLPATPPLPGDRVLAIEPTALQQILARDSLEKDLRFMAVDTLKVEKLEGAVRLSWTSGTQSTSLTASPNPELAAGAL